MDVKEVKITVRQFLTKSSSNPKYKDKTPVPMRVMFGYIKRETANAVYVSLRGKAKPGSICFNCGRSLTHPVSLLYSIGPECGRHYYDSPMPKQDIENWYEEIKKGLEDVTWEGWLPKGHIGIEETGNVLEVKETDVTFSEEPKTNTVEKDMKEQAVQLKEFDDDLIKTLTSELLS